MVPPARTLFRLPADEIYREDGRRRIWVVTAADGSRYVLKLHPGSPFLQLATTLLGRHRLQREAQLHQFLIEDSHSAARPLLTGCQWTIFGCRRWLATPFLGLSLDLWIRYGGASLDPQRRHLLTRALGRLWGRMLIRSLAPVALEAGDVVVDEQNRLSLVGGSRIELRSGAIETPEGLALLTSFQKSLEEACQRRPTDRITRTDRLRFLQALAEVWSPRGFPVLRRRAQR